MMKYYSIKVLVLIAAVVTIASCKKEKGTPDIYFSATSASTSRGGEPVVVNIELSEASDEVVEFYIESTGEDALKLGSINEAYVHDDSSKCRALIGSGAFIEEPGHVVLGRGIKSVTITFTPLYDAFPHASANFKVKLKSAINANVRESNSEFALSISDADLVKDFSSLVTYLGYEGAGGYPLDTIPEVANFVLESFEHTPNGDGTFTLKLNYNKQDGNSALTNMKLTYTAFPAVQQGSVTLQCSSNPISIEFEPSNIIQSNYTCSDIFAAKTIVNGVDNNSSVYGDYKTFTGSIAVQDSFNFYLNGSVGSNFLLNQ